ncbi:EAL domain-containing protein [Actinokineospora soli]|uniref:EAL domain-containing protein n=1 Tax=Actinokineospora soli TaxID=1048753 RepID=A0ABW2TUE1_9PSEU
MGRRPRPRAVGVDRRRPPGGPRPGPGRAAPRRRPGAAPGQDGRARPVGAVRPRPGRRRPLGRDPRRGHAGRVGAGRDHPGYRPVVRLADGAVAGVEAVLRWAHPRHPVPHEMCVELAERTGLALPLGEWLLGTVAAQVRWWRQRGIVSAPMTLALTPHQSADADLVSRVARALDATGLPAAGLSIAVPVRAVAEPEAADNLGVLAEMGVRTALSDFAFGADDLAAARRLDVDHVRVARRLVDLRATEDAPHVASLVAALAGDGVVVAVDGVATEEQEAWWRAAGADLATGPRFGPDLTAPEFLARIAP